MKKIKNILAVASSDGLDLIRIQNLFKATNFEVEIFVVSRRRKFRSFRKLIDLLPGTYDLIFLEGSGLVSTAFALWANRIHKIPFILSTGDPTSGFYKITKSNLWGWIFSQFEKVILRNCELFLGWTPYLTGRALSLGAKKAFTLEGGVDLQKFKPSAESKVFKLKKKLGLKKYVIGVCGSLIWVNKQNYCYGLELVKMLKFLKRTDVSVLIIGDGPGRSRLETIFAKDERIIFTGKIPYDNISDYLSLLDVGFVTQTLDELGNFRLTTKLPEYLACGVTVAMSPIPGFYDYVWPNGIVLPTGHPASDSFAKSLAEIVDNLDFKKLGKNKSKNIDLAQSKFSYETIAKKMVEIINGIWQE